ARRTGWCRVAISSASSACPRASGSSTRRRARRRRPATNADEPPRTRRTMNIAARPVTVAMLAAAVLAGAFVGAAARGSEVLAAACQRSAPADEPCRGALEQAAAGDVLALAEQWVAA